MENDVQVGFTGQLRPSQQEVVEIARAQFADGEHRLHVVAPPGSGKTVLGLYLWAELATCPAVVLSPNSAIQAQWATRAAQFCGLEPSQISQDPQQPGLFTSLTYQSVTLPGRQTASLQEAAVEAWMAFLVEKEHAATPEEAKVWIEDLQKHSPDYYRQRLASYTKRVRDLASQEAGGALEHLHDSARQTLERLRDAGVGLVILDECHHLMGHWGRVLRDAHDFLEHPLVVGLTATPPERKGRDSADLERYDVFFGPVDYEIPVPALVRDGFLAPYQDLVYLVRPTPDELAFIAGTDKAFTELVDQLCLPEEGRAGLLEWVQEVLSSRKIGPYEANSWGQFERRDPAFAAAGSRLLLEHGYALPRGVPAPAAAADPDLIVSTLAPVLDRYVRHFLRRSADPALKQLGTRVMSTLRTLGVQITETGMQPCASPVSRVMAYSRAKATALRTILASEMTVLGDSIRAVVVADYEKTSAVGGEISHLLDDEAGGAVAAFRALLEDEGTDALDPILVTGSSVLVDDDLRDRIDHEAVAWLTLHGADVELTWSAYDGFYELHGTGADWCPRVYVRMITDLFQRGVTRCLVGTRGLLGEGWDANRINVLVDLTTVTTSMSVNQLRGRSIRLDPECPEKVANNWDVICLAPEFHKGLADYLRFRAKHRTLYGVTDDSAIEKGVGHVHPAFTEMKPEGVEGSVGWINDEMLERAGMRGATRSQWRIGQPYDPTPVSAVELKLGAGFGGGFPPFGGVNQSWSDESLTAAIGGATLLALREVGEIDGGELHVGARGPDYVRVFLKTADEKEMALFAESIREVLGALGKVRYIIPRSVTDVEQSWLSRMLPEVVGRYFQKRHQRLAMWHAVPSALAGKKETVAVFERHWNELVSPGQAVYVLRGQGEEILQHAREGGLTPQPEAVHEKEIFT
jgi:hypothetical protein